MKAKTITELELLRPISEIHEDHGYVLLWPANGDPPEVGHCLDNDFVEEDWQYFSMIPDVKTQEEM